MSVCFNKSYTALVTSTPEGYKLFDIVDSTYPADTTKLKRSYETPEGKISLIGDLLDDFVGVMVLENRPKELILWDFDNKTEKGTFTYLDDIVAAKLSSTFIIVFFFDKILIHDHKDESRFEICMPPNPKGICDLVSTDQFSRLAYPDGKGTYDMYKVMVKDVTTTHNIVRIDAHKDPITAIAFSRCGFQIAITCEKGHEIFVFNSQTGVKLHTCFRGLTIVTISSLVFSKNGTYLAASSNSTTVHIFYLSSACENLAMEPEFGLMLPEGRDGSGSICGIKGEGYKFRLMITLPQHCLYVHDIPDFFGQSIGSNKLFDLLRIEETEVV